MNAMRSKSAILHAKLRRALQSGRYSPGHRLDPATIATEFDTSLTPVRDALARLVGDGLVEDHARSGWRVPLPSEAALRDLYAWMQRLLLIACAMAPAKTTQPPGRKIDLHAGADIVKLTWQLFDAIGQAPGQRYLHRAIKRANNQLAPIRRAKLDLMENIEEELSALNNHWQARDIRALRIGLRTYHERRIAMVPRIVDLLQERANEQL